MTKPYPKPEKKIKIKACDFRKKYGKRLKTKNAKPKLSDKVKELDKWFSRAVRLMWVDDGLVKCASCSKKDHPKNMDCGHFFNRDSKALRWSFNNCRPQCPVRSFGCNSKMDRPEVQNAFRQTLISQGVNIEAMEIKRRNTVKYTVFELDLLIKECQGIVKYQLKNKNIEKWW